MAVLTSLRMSAKLENLGRLIRSLSDCTKAQGFEQEKISKIELAAEEALVNVFRYTYPEAPGDAEMICKLEGGCSRLGKRRFTQEQRQGLKLISFQP